ncbi:MAG: carboxypeptidase-like regulatory domain-containing protein [Methanomassiliicoccus sp.]|nr:carboxypeptidase-like regulatory domain-containing protein [Methanomassiliicoccus sp.]
MDGIKRKIKIVSILIIAFAIMVAALIYYPYGKCGVTHDTNNPIVLNIHGLVTDEDGTPLENASVSALGPGVITTTTDASGLYSLTFNALLELNLSAMATGHWAEFTTIYPSDEKTDIVANFTLWHCPVVSIPLGIATFVDSSDNISNYTWSLNLTNSCYLLKQIDSDRTISMSLSAGNLICNTSVESGLTMLFMKVSIIGSYWMGNKTIIGFGCEALGPAYGVQLNMSSPDLNASSWNYTTYNLAYGEQANITLATKNASYSFISNFVPSLTLDALGKNITFQELGMQTFDYIIEGEQSINFTGMMASINITPSTTGDHQYEVFTEDRCIICIREVMSA